MWIREMTYDPLAKTMTAFTMELRLEGLMSSAAIYYTLKI